MLQRLPVAMRTSRVEIALFIGLCALWFCPTCPFLTPAMSSRSCGARRLGAARRGGGGEARGAARSWADSNCSAPPTLRILLRPQLTAASAAGRSTRSEGKCSPLFLQQSAGGARRSETQGGRRGGETVSAPRILRRRSSNSRLHQQAGPGLPEGDEGIADLASLANPAKEKDYGDNRALQYGVSVGADAAGAGAAHHFFSADTRVVFGVNALEIGLVELYDMGLQRAMIVTGWNQARADPVVWELLPRGFDLKWHSVEAEPSLSDVAKGVSLALEHRADCVVAMGGAAVIDAAKAIAAIVYADKDSAKAARRLLDAASEPRETAPPGAPAEAADPAAAPLLGPVPLVAIPIIAGTGAEVTPMATILDDKDPLEPEKVTVGFHTSAAAMPAPFMAIVEPRLMMRVDLETTWPRAFVALAGCVEGYVSGRGFVPDLLSHQGIERVSRCLARDLGFRGPLYEEREDIAYAGVIRGLVASRTEWSSLHQLATAVAAVSNAPYASCVARLFPRVLEAQIAKLRREEDAYMDAEHRRRTRARRSGGGSGSSEGGGIAADGDKSVSTGGSGGGREKTYSDDYNDRACAALLKYKRVAGFILGQGGQGGREDSGSGTGRRRRGGGASAAGPSPEDIVEWLDARLLDKNVPPLYRMGLRPEHAPSVVGVLLRNGGVGNDGKTGGAYSALGGLGEAVVMEVVVGEASRQDGDEGGLGGGEAEEAPAEVAAAVAAMFGEGQGQDGPTQRGPWQHRQQ